MFFIHRLLMFAACMAAMPCSAVIYQYASMVNPVTGHHVHLLGDWHFGSLDTTSKQVDDLSIFVKNIKRSKELIVEDMASKAAIVKESIEDIYLPDQHTPLKYSEFGYGMQNIPVHNVDFRIGEEEFLQAAREAMQYDDSHPIIKDYYTSVKINFNQVVYDPSFATTTSNSVCDMLNMHIIHRIRHNERNSVNHSIVMAGGEHVECIRNVLNAIGYQPKMAKGMTTAEAQDLLQDILTSAEKKFQDLEKDPTTIIDILSHVGDKIALDIPSVMRQT